MPSGKRDYAVTRRLLFISALAAFIGLLGTLAAGVLVHLIRLFTNLFFFQSLSWSDRPPHANQLGAWVVLVPALGGLLVGLMARFGSARIRGHGIPEAIEAVLFNKSLISWRVALLKPVASAVAIGSGGPFGAEGPIIMTGGAVGSLVAQAFHLTAAERRTLLVAGASAGMTAVFGTPLAAVLLAVELLLFELRPRSLLPVMAACAVAATARAAVLEPGALFPLPGSASGPAVLPAAALLGLAGGVLSSVLSRAIYVVEDAFERLPIHWMWWPAASGLVVGVGGLLEPRALGVGYDVIRDLLNQGLPWSGALALLAVKAAIWAIALGSGTSGGVLAPVLMIGAGLGAMAAPWLPLHGAVAWPLVGMASTLAGVMGTPLTAVAFAFELTRDPDAILPLLVAAAVSFGFTILMSSRSILTEKIARRGLHTYREYGVDPLERLHVHEVMTPAPQCIGADKPVAAVLHDEFGSAQQHRAYPVTDAHGRLLGMVERDLLLATKVPPQATMREVLADQAVEFALPGESCRSLANRLGRLGRERLPVVEDGADLRLIGVVSRSDLIDHGRELFEHDEVMERHVTLVGWLKP